MSGIFICYRREDSQGLAGRLFDRLALRFGRERVFRDVDGIDPGAPFSEVIGERIGACDAVVVLIGRRWLDAKDTEGRRRLDLPRDFVKVEIAAALAQGKLLIPALIEGATMPAREALPEEIAALADRNTLPISDSRFDFDIGRLISLIDKFLPTQQSAIVRRAGVWAWLSDPRTLALVSVGTAAFVVAAWSLYLYFTAKAATEPLMQIMTIPSATPADTSVSAKGSSAVATSKPKEVDGATATIVFSFGGQGIGPGLFTDPRHFALDRRGQIIVAEFGGRSRVQRFDLRGKFISQFFASDKDGDNNIYAMALAENGFLYIVQNLGFFRYDGNTAERLTLENSPRFLWRDFKAMATNPLGGLVMMWDSDRGGQDLVFLDSLGKERLYVKNPLRAHESDSSFWPALAVDALGYIYVLETHKDMVYKLSFSGEFLNRFGGKGVAPGQIESASAIAVNGKGEVFVKDIWLSSVRFERTISDKIQTSRLEGRSRGDGVR